MFEVSEENSRHQVQQEQVLQFFHSKTRNLFAHYGCQKFLRLQGKTEQSWKTNQSVISNDTETYPAQEVTEARPVLEVILLVLLLLFPYIHCLPYKNEQDKCIFDLIGNHSLHES